jgi:hypothetical protein
MFATFAAERTPVPDRVQRRRTPASGRRAAMSRIAASAGLALRTRHLLGTLELPRALV